MSQMKVDYLEQLKECYHKVFGENGEIKPCGRQACRDLISVCYKIDDSGTFYGNSDTGVMQVHTIKKLNEQLGVIRTAVR